MTLPALLDDALRRTSAGSEVLLSLPWIRSLPLESLHDVALTIDGVEVDVLTPAGTGWWYIQDRVVLRGGPAVEPGEHDVAISFSLDIPYLAAGPDGPLALPFREVRRLVAA